MTELPFDPKAFSRHKSRMYKLFSQNTKKNKMIFEQNGLSPLKVPV